MQFSEKPGTRLGNKILSSSVLQSSANQNRPEPICTRQGQSSATKDKGKEPYTDFAAKPAENFNLRNNQVRSYDMKIKNFQLFSEKVKKDCHLRCKGLPIGGGEIAKKLNSTNRGFPGSHFGIDRNLILAHFNPSNTDDKSVCEVEAEDPLDWWVNEEIPQTHDSASSDDVDMVRDEAKLKGSWMALIMPGA